jgi:hypothetical protein
VERRKLERRIDADDYDREHGHQIATPEQKYARAVTLTPHIVEKRQNKWRHQ